MPTLQKADLSTGTVSALGDGVTVQSKPVFLYIYIPGAVMGTQRMLERLQLRIKERKLLQTFVQYNFL